ncbi:MAG: ABC transporter ATP-binding protein [Verrucomicrobiota bacterium]
MASDTVIHVEHLAKRYLIQHQAAGAKKGTGKMLSERVQASAKGIFGGFFGRKDIETGKSTTEEFWALKDVSFEVKRGEVLGIVGRNGAGKSTLLKLLSRITDPTRGEIRIKGRVASLLEVGTGFHPELTGRENVFLNGAILGMSREQIRAKFDEIVAFAEIEKFLDTPVKYYSSGMYVRLAFAVAAHLEPDILIVDEVLAVGDMAFQKKCLASMEATTQQGRTVLLVSHNMPTVLSLCTRAVLLSGGVVASEGPPAKVLDVYQNNLRSGLAAASIQGKRCRILRAWLGNEDSDGERAVSMSEDFRLRFEYEVHHPDPCVYVPFVQVCTEEGQVVFHVNAERLPAEGPGKWHAACTVPAWLLNAGNYHAHVYVVAFPTTGYELWAEEQMAVTFTVTEDTPHPARYTFGGMYPGIVRPRLAWDVKRLS